MKKSLKLTKKIHNPTIKIYKANLGTGEVYIHETSMNLSRIPSSTGLEETCLF